MTSHTMSQRRIRVLIVDDHSIVRTGLAATIDPEPDMEVIGSAANGHDAIQLFRDKVPDVTIMDLSLTPEMNGVQAIQTIRREFPAARIIVLSAYKGEEDIYRALQAGAVTYLLKETLGEDLIPIIREVDAGGGPIPPYVARKLADRLTQAVLTPREVEVLKLVAAGKRNKEIAGTLGISETTIQGHVKSILAKLNVHDRTEAVTLAIRRAIIRLD
jgi:two-component system NarL family response regulator